MGRVARTWRLMAASWGILKKDRELMLFPALSSVAVLLVLLSFAWPLFDRQTLESLRTASRDEPFVYAVLFAFYFCNYFVVIFFNAAAMACALARMRGNDPTVGFGLRSAWQRLPQIVGWALLSSTVGFVLRMIEDRVQVVGRIVAALLGMAWTVTSFLVVPVLVAEGSGPVDAYRRSVALLKRSWGEQIIGNMGFGVIFILLSLLPVGAVVLAMFTGNRIVLDWTLAIAAVCLIVLALVSSALQAIYHVAIYHYAAEGRAPGGFDEGLLANAFRRK